MKQGDREKYFIVIVIVLALALSLFYFNVGKPKVTYSLDKTFNVTEIALTHNGQTADYYVYVAKNLAQQQQGYMNQTSLGDCDSQSPCLGMLFQFQNTSNYCFWMENTIIPLKQAWISQNETVVYVYNATPYSIRSVCYTGIAVLETSPNQTIVVGDRIVAAKG